MALFPARIVALDVRQPVICEFSTRLQVIRSDAGALAARGFTLRDTSFIQSGAVCAEGTRSAPKPFCLASISQSYYVYDEDDGTPFRFWANGTTIHFHQRAPESFWEGNELVVHPASQTECVLRARRGKLLNLSPTSTWTTYPLPRLRPDCVVTVNTSSLFAANCPLPRACAPIFVQDIRTDFWGGESRVCVGLSMLPPALNSRGEPTNRRRSFSRNPARWGQLYRATLPPECDVCTAMRDTLVLRFGEPEDDLVLEFDDVRNLVVWNTDTKSYQIRNMSAVNGPHGPCLANAGQAALAVPVLNWVPRTMAWAAPLPPHLWVNLTHRNLSDGSVVLGVDPVTCYGGCEFIFSGGRYTAGPGTQLCISDRVVGGTSNPFVAALSAVADYLATEIVFLVRRLFEWAFEAIAWVWVNIDAKYPVTQALFLFLLLIWRFDSPYAAGVGALAYLWVRGPKDAVGALG